MALDFNLELIMPQHNCRIFRRSAIEATCYLIKDNAPSIANHLYDIVNGDPLPLEESEDPHQRLYFVDLTIEQIRQLIEVLSVIYELPSQTNTPGLAELTANLHQEWQQLADELALQSHACDQF